MQQIQIKNIDRNPESADSLLIWTWRNDPVTRHMSRNEELISWEDHKAWYARTVEGSQQLLLMVSLGEMPACMIRFDSINKTRAEISFNLDPALRGKGFSQSILSEACNYGFNSLDFEEIYAEVKSKNKVSIKILEAVGFILQGSQEGLLSYSLKKNRTVHYSG